MLLGIIALAKKGKHLNGQKKVGIKGTRLGATDCCAIGYCGMEGSKRRGRACALAVGLADADTTAFSAAALASWDFKEPVCRGVSSREPMAGAQQPNTRKKNAYPYKTQPLSRIGGCSFFLQPYYAKPSYSGKKSDRMAEPN